MRHSVQSIIFNSFNNHPQVFQYRDFAREGGGGYEISRECTKVNCSSRTKSKLLPREIGTLILEPTACQRVLQLKLMIENEIYIYWLQFLFPLRFKFLKKERRKNWEEIFYIYKPIRFSFPRERQYRFLPGMDLLLSRVISPARNDKRIKNYLIKKERKTRLPQ